MLFRLAYPSVLLAWFILVPLGYLLLRNRRHPLARTRAILFVLGGLAIAIFAMARPQRGFKQSSRSALQGTLYIAMDISQSMLTGDIAPSRLEFASLFSQQLLHTLLPSQVAIFPFAADGYLALPPTQDLTTVEDFLTTVQPSYVSEQGTDLSTALSTLASLIERRKQQFPEDRAPAQVLLLSDGETHQAIPTSLTARFAKLDVPIHTVGTGTPQGGRVPLRSDLSLIGKAELPISKLDAKPLRLLSERTGGKYVPGVFSNASVLGRYIERKMAFGKVQTSFKVEHEWAPLCLLIALIFLGWEMLLLGRWKYAVRILPWWLLFFQTPLWAVSPEREATTLYNSGVELIRSNPKEALDAFQRTIELTSDPEMRKRALYNLGTLQMKLGQLGQAVDNYQAARDIQAPSKEFNDEANARISANLELAAQQMAAAQSDGDSDEKNGDNGNADSRKGPKKDYDAQPFSEDETNKMMKLLSQEEQRLLQKMQRKHLPNRADYKGKPW